MSSRASLLGLAISAAVVSLSVPLGHSALAADPPARRAAPLAADPAIFIWGAIAFSPQTGSHGFFWGGSTQVEARRIAIEHCANAGGSGCAVVSEFMSFRDNNAPYAGRPVTSCGALSVAHAGTGVPARWGASSAITRKDAETLSLQRCGGSACEIREWVCT